MRRFLLAIAATCSLAAKASGATLIGPSPYLSSADSPFIGLPLGWFHLETVEDGLLNTPGVSVSPFLVLAPGVLTDSVDADDGFIDGSGQDGRSIFYGAGSVGITFTFSSVVLGSLPTHAGIVWTDGGGSISFEAWDQNGISLGTLSGGVAAATNSGQTNEDRFYGVINAGGISKIKVSNTGGGIEADHLQYGGGVPEPGTAVLALGGGAWLWLRRRAAGRPAGRDRCEGATGG